MKILIESQSLYKRGFIVVLLMCAFGTGASRASGADKNVLPLLNYPHAGVSISMPPGFTTIVVSDSFVVTRAVMTISRKPVQAVTLRAVVVGAKTTARDFADATEEDLKSLLSVRKFEGSKKSVSIKVAGITGVARVLKYTYDGIATNAANVFFIREFKDSALRICYVLTVEVADRYEKKLLPTLGALIKSIKLTTLQAPAAITTRLTEMKLSDYKGGFSVCVPEGWYGHEVQGGVSLGQKNYIIGGANSPQVAILSIPVDKDASSQTIARKAVAKYLDASTKPDGGVKVLSHGPVKVNDQDAYQYIIKLTYELITTTQPATQPTTQPATTTTSQPATQKTVTKVEKIEAVRVLCRRDSNGKSVMAYLFALSCLENEAKLVTPWFDALGKGFKYFPLTVSPAKP
ncbi:MAG: hypothetical protein GY794_03280 [bacterium]|nr:hypothetical protein [bacterium]